MPLSPTSLRAVARLAVLIGGVVAFVVVSNALASAAEDAPAEAPTSRAAAPQDPCPIGLTCDAVTFVDEFGRWHRYGTVNAAGASEVFYYGNPGDIPFAGDWDCDGTTTPGLYRQSDGFAYLRNSNTEGIADIEFFFGNPDDIPLVGDFDGDGCDTLSLYRRSEARVYIIDRLGDDGGGLGTADYFFTYGNPGDIPFVGDFDGDGVDSIGLFRESTAQVYLRNDLSSGPADSEFVYGDPGDQILTGDWDDDGVDTLAVFRPGRRALYVNLTNASGPADITLCTGAFERAVALTGLGPAFDGDAAGGCVPLPGPDDVIGTFTTYHDCCRNRVVNIHLIADAVDGAVVFPGETWSLNTHVGPRTVEKGYLLAGAIIGPTVQCCSHPSNVGGGTSQFATTLFNAIFFSGVEDVYHRPHTLYFSRYPAGREATLGEGICEILDVCFRNDTDSPIVIDTSYTDTSITVSFLGDNGGRQVTARNDPWIYTSRPEKICKTDTNLYQTGSNGFKVVVYRDIAFSDGSTRTDEWTTFYAAQPTVEDCVDGVPVSELPPPPPPPPPPDVTLY